MKARIYPFTIIFFAMALVLMSLPLAIDPAEVRASSFHFTVTSDMRGIHTAFGNLCDSINSEVGGPGAFHVSVGDIDSTIPENRAVIDTKFGSSAIWYPIIGNHEAETGADMQWLREEYDNGNSLRTPLKNYTNQDGPTGTVRVNYSWDYENAHFIALNEYWNGGTSEGSGTSLSGSDTATDGDIVPELYDWLAADLAANTKPFVFVFGHEPAFPYTRHVGDSLDKYETHRDDFWALLECAGVDAYFNGHTHYYSKHQGDKNHVGNVWQLDVGNAGWDYGDGLTYFDVVVGDDQATVNVYRETGTSFSLADSVTLHASIDCLQVNGEGLADGTPIPSWNLTYFGISPVASVTATDAQAGIHSGDRGVQVNGDNPAGIELDNVAKGIITVDYWHYPKPGSDTNSVFRFFGGSWNGSSESIWDYLYVTKNDQDKCWVDPGAHYVGDYSGSYTHFVITIDTCTGLSDLSIDEQHVYSGTVDNADKIGTHGIRYVTINSGRGGAGTDSYFDDLLITATATSTSTPTPTPEGGCFIATAAYGTSTAAEIDTLRAFRDEVLLQSSLGSQIVDWYYQTSPPVAAFISENDVLRTLVRELLVDPIASLVEATEAIWGD